MTKIICPLCDGAGCVRCDFTCVQVGCLCPACQGAGCPQCDSIGVSDTPKQKNPFIRNVLVVLLCVFSIVVVLNLDTVIYLLQALTACVLFYVFLTLVKYLW